MNKKLKVCLFLLFLMPVTACTDSGSQWDGGINDQWDYAFRWSITVAAPQHYDVWVSKFIVESVTEDIGWSAPIGTLSCCWKAPRGKGAGWQALPEQFLIEWFSFAEQTSYLALIELEDPEGLFEKMQEPAPYMWRGEKATMPRYNLVLGLAPGGQIVMWIMNQKETAIEVGRYQGKPFDHRKLGQDYTRRTESYLERSGEYLEEHGLQLDKW